MQRTVDGSEILLTRLTRLVVSSHHSQVFIHPQVVSWISSIRTTFLEVLTVQNWKHSPNLFGLQDAWAKKNVRCDVPGCSRHSYIYIWVFPKIGVPQNGWKMENPIKMDDLGGNTPIFGNTYIIYIYTLSMILLIFKGFGADTCFFPVSLPKQPTLDEDTTLTRRFEILWLCQRFRTFIITTAGDDFIL